jgi:ABC-type glycerol-3-phosphate transport system substrate-binding protein
MSDSPLTNRLRVLALIAGCVAVLGLAACGGDDDDSSSTTTTPAETTDATTDTTSVDTSDLPDAEALRDQFNQQLLQVLTTSQNLTQAQAECAIDELENSVSDEELQQAIVEAAQSGEPPQDLIDSAFDAGASCAGE